jgi:hypothetical protein
VKCISIVRNFRKRYGKKKIRGITLTPFWGIETTNVEYENLSHAPLVIFDFRFSIIFQVIFN